MERKEFIKKASLLVGGAAMAPVLKGFAMPKAPSAQSVTLKKGLGYGMINEDLSLLDKFKLVKDLGFDGVEFNSPVETPLREILDARDKTGVALPSVVNKDHWAKPLSDPDASVREEIIKSVTKSLEEVKELGGDTVLVVPGVVNEKVPYEVAYTNALESIRKLIPHAERTGMKIGLENVWNNFLISPVEARDFLDEIDHPLVGWYFDIGNVLRYGWPEHWIAALNSRIVKLHAKEFSRAKMNDEGLWKGFDVELGSGDINWPLVMDSLKNVGHNGGWLTVEVGGGDRNHLQKISSQMDAIMGR